MKRHYLAAMFGVALAVAANAGDAQVAWNGSTSTNPLDGANWNGGIAPAAGDVAEIGNSPQSPDFAGQTATWGKVNLFFANNIGDTGGGGTLNLVGPDSSQLFSAGDGHLTTIEVDIVATKNIQTNGTHSVTFNGDVTAAKVEAFGGSAATFNGVVHQTDEFMSIGGGSKIVINNEFYWGNNNHGVNNSPVVELGPGAKFYRPDGGGGWLEGLDVFNVYDGAVVRLLGDNALGTHGETEIWTRNTTNTFDLNGYNQFVEFFGMGDAPAALKIDFGGTSGPNKLIWDAAAGLNGPGGFQVLNFEPGVDTLEFGQYGDNNGFHNPATLARITVNGAAYSTSSPGPGTPWWSAEPTPDLNDDPGRQVVVYHAAVPEPAALLLGMISLAGLGAVLRRQHSTK